MAIQGNFGIIIDVAEEIMFFKRVNGKCQLYSVGRDFDDGGGKKTYGWSKKDGDRIFWPTIKAKKKDLTDGSMMMPGMLPAQPE